VFFNNHANGRAAVNAEAVEMLLKDRYGDAASEVIARPLPIVPARPERQLDLFAELES
jgi:hypothetical protein